MEVSVAYFKLVGHGRLKLAVVDASKSAGLISKGWQQITAKEYADTRGDCMKLDLRARPDWKVRL